MGMILNLFHHLLRAELLVLVSFHGMLSCCHHSEEENHEVSTVVFFSCGHSLFVSSHCLCVNNRQCSAPCRTLQTLLSEAVWASGSSLDAEWYCSVQTGFRALSTPGPLD